MRTSISFASLTFFILFAIGAAAGFGVYKTTGSQIAGEAVGGVGFVAALIVSLSIKVADQWERVVILRLGKFHSLKGPGLFLIIPIIDVIPYWIDTIVVVPSSVIDTMQLGGISGVAAVAVGMGKENGHAQANGQPKELELTR